ncbi:hypothetical protein HPB47_027606 [Ixodes persulcatus]|uniref:Uncharacterized protein n=1 Tax=Ixodes persulcatus TaxID=34615 RepID=A0AC60PX52_IXOPE|nr:hypothetical protein HPB47_027606 [Ixodes persulcatus]
MVDHVTFLEHAKLQPGTFARIAERAAGLARTFEPSFGAARRHLAKISALTELARESRLSLGHLLSIHLPTVFSLLRTIEHRSTALDFICDPAPERRTAWKLLEKATEGTAVVPVSRVKGPSLAMTLPRFDVVDGFIPDYQHSACLGIMRQLPKLWLESEYHDCPWYIGRKVSLLNSLLLAGVDLLLNDEITD